MNPEQKAAVLAAIADVSAMITGTGRHAEHTRKQVGRCVYCSCGLRAQGRMATPPEVTE